MSISTITITDVEGDAEGRVDTKVTYDVSEEDQQSPLTSATLYGYTIHYLFRTGKINEYISEVIEELNNLEDESNDQVQNS